MDPPQAGNADQGHPAQNQGKISMQRENRVIQMMFVGLKQTCPNHEWRHTYRQSININSRLMQRFPFKKMISGFKNKRADQKRNRKMRHHWMKMFK